MDFNCCVPLEGSLCFSWSSSQTITVFQKAKSSDDTSSTLFEVQCFASAKKNAFLQRLIRASYDIFRVCQVCKDSSDLLRLSHQYRAVLAMCYQEIYGFLGTNKNLPNENLMALTADGDLVKTFELLWHLAEAVLLQTPSSCRLTPSLTDWYFVQSQEAINMARDMLEKPSMTGGVLELTAESEETFWSIAVALTTQARPLEVSALLASHPRANSSLFRNVRQLLNAMPLEDPTSEATWQKSGSFEKAWQHWQSVCNVQLMEEMRVHASSDDVCIRSLLLILSILSGQNDCWNNERVVDACGTWYFAFVGWLFYTHRSADVSSLTKLMEKFRLEFDVFPTEAADENSLAKVAEEVIGHIFAEDILSVVYALSDKFNNWWMVAHFSNIVKHLIPDYFASEDSSQPSEGRFSLKIESSSNGSETPSGTRRLTSTMPDFFLLRYAESLAADPSLLSVALGYLDHCTTLRSMARGIQASFVQHTKPSPIRQTHRLIQLAKKHNAVGVVSEICRTKSRASLTFLSGSLETSDIASFCSSLGWAIAACDVQLVAHVITRTLAQSAADSANRCSSWKLVKEVARVVTCLFSGEGSRGSRSWVAPLIASPGLAFLSRYADLQNALNTVTVPQVITQTVFDLLSTTDSYSEGFHVSPSFKLHLLKQLRPYLSPGSLRREEAEVLGTTVTDLKATLLLRKAKLDEETRGLLMDLSTLLMQARAAAILAGRMHDASEDRLASRAPSEFVASEICSIVD